MVAITTEMNLGKFHIRIHTRGRSDEPRAQPFAGPAGGGFVVVDPPGGGERSNVSNEGKEAFVVTAGNQLEVVLAIACDVGQAIRFGGIGPGISGASPLGDACGFSTTVTIGARSAAGALAASATSSVFSRR